MLDSDSTPTVLTSAGVLQFSSDTKHPEEILSDFRGSRAQFPSSLLQLQTPIASRAPDHPYFCPMKLQIQRVPTIRMTHNTEDSAILTTVLFESILIRPSK